MKSPHLFFSSLKKFCGLIATFFLAVKYHQQINNTGKGKGERAAMFVSVQRHPPPLVLVIFANLILISVVSISLYDILGDCPHFILL